MSKRLRVPAAIAFVMVAGCGGDDNECSMTREPCVQDPRTAEVCPQDVCVDSSRQCPTGCIPAGSKRYCLPDGTDAGMCPQPAICVVDGQSCPAGCTPVG